MTLFAGNGSLVTFTEEILNRKLHFLGSVVAMGFWPSDCGSNKK